MNPYLIATLLGAALLAALTIYFVVRTDRLERRLEMLEERDENKLVRPK